MLRGDMGILLAKQGKFRDSVEHLKAALDAYDKYALASCFVSLWNLGR
jgi:hypothetical protein